MRKFPRPDKSVPVLDMDGRSMTQAWFDFFGYLNSGGELSAGATGGVTFPNGLIVKWGTTAGGGDSTVTFATPFPNNCWAVYVSPTDAPNTTTEIFTAATNTETVNGFNIRPRFYHYGVTTGGVATQRMHWLAIGN